MDDDRLGTTFGFEINLNETKKQSEALLQEAPPITPSVSDSEEYGDVNGASLEIVGSRGETAVSGTQESQPSDDGEGLAFYPSDGSNGAVSYMFELGDSEIQKLEPPAFCGESEFPESNIYGKKPFLEKGEGIGVSVTQEFEVAFNKHHEYLVCTSSDNDDDGKLVKCTWKIGVVDDNSLVETSEVRDEALKQEIGCCVDTKKRLKRQVKAGRNKNSRADEDININVPSIVEENDKEKSIYSRKELEALRNEGLDGQMRRWVAIYSGLGPFVQKEYDGLVQLHQPQQQKKKKNKKVHMTLNVDPEFQNGVATVFFGEESSHAANYGIKNLKPMDPAAGFLLVDAETTGAIRQGNHMDDDDGDEAYDSIQKPAFVVTGEPDFNSGPPEDGLEYLRRVRWEAAQIPKVKVAKVEASKLNKMQTVYMPQVPDIPQCPAHLMPLDEWEGAFLADFSELRLDVKESFNNHFESIMLENNCEYLKTTIDNDFYYSASTSHPTLCVMLRMNSVARAFMLRKHIGMAEKAMMLSREDCMWLFALCAAVDWPVDADTCAALRSLLRKCASLRVVKEEMDEEVIMLNILATIAGKYFGQSET